MKIKNTQRGFTQKAVMLNSFPHPHLTHPLSKADEILNQVQDDNRWGFTLIELLVVVLIIGILAAVAVPQYQFAVMKSRVGTILPVLTSIKQAEEIYYLTNGEYTGSIENLDVDLPQCPNEQYYGDIKICGDWMIDLLTADEGLNKQRVRAAYCPSTIKSTRIKWDDCAYHSGDFTITVWLNHSSYPNRISCGDITPIGEKICKWINNR